MPTWFTSRPCWPGGKSHISHVVFDETWEASEAYRIENNPNVAAWVKNDHLGFAITYTYQGVVRKYIPDFLIRLANGLTLVLEVKGRETEKNRVKREALKDWVATVKITFSGVRRRRVVVLWLSRVAHTPWSERPNLLG